jgi:hypothetical protein
MFRMVSMSAFDACGKAMPQFPEAVKVAGVSLGDDVPRVAARVVIVGRVERLMQVADEVQEELERQQPLRGGGRIP